MLIVHPLNQTFTWEWSLTAWRKFSGFEPKPLLRIRYLIGVIIKSAALPIPQNPHTLHIVWGNAFLCSTGQTWYMTRQLCYDIYWGPSTVQRCIEAESIIGGLMTYCTNINRWRASQNLIVGDGLTQIFDNDFLLQRGRITLQLNLFTYTEFVSSDAIDDEFLNSGTGNAWAHLRI